MSKYILSEIYPTMADFFESAPGIDANLTFSDLNATALSSRKIISDIITDDIWNTIKEEVDTLTLLYLRSAFANLIMYKYQIFKTVQDRHSSKSDTFKYELEAMKRQYVDNYHNAMDSLLRELISNDSYNWGNTDTAKLINALHIRTVNEFQKYYHIDTSFLYFIRTIPIQSKLLLQKFKGYIDKISERPDLLESVNFALVYAIIGTSLQQFDLIEFPPTIRNYFDDNTLSRNGKDERDAVSNMATNMLNESDDFLKNIDLTLQSENETDIYTGNPDNSEDNKYYFPG